MNLYFIFCSFASTIDKFVIRKPHRPQDLSATQDSYLTQDSSSKHGRVSY